MSVATGGTAAGMPGLPEVRQWEEQLVGFGTRYTGAAVMRPMWTGLPGSCRRCPASGCRPTG